MSAQRSPVPVSVDVAKEMDRLRDFQRDTAHYAFARLFGDGADSTSRFLVADEVGLGKTMVARGVIAQTIAHLQEQGDDRVDVVYICSNQAIAQQNLRKLAPDGTSPVDKQFRLSLLPFHLDGIQGQSVNLVALTPGTSLKLGNSGGTLAERASLLAALREVWSGHRLRGKGILTLFAGDGRVGTGGYESKEERIRAVSRWYHGRLSDRAVEYFAEELKKIDAEYLARFDQNLDDRIHYVAGEFRAGAASRNDSRLRLAGEERRCIIKRLREAMATTGAHLLQPDIVVLDEFQRFRDVLHSDEDDEKSKASAEDRYAASIAKHLLDFHHADHDRTARVLLLSATPYAMHTAAVHAAGDPTVDHHAAESNEHYDDFLATYAFLAKGLPGEPDVEAKIAALSRELYALRRGIVDAPDNGAEPARRAAEQVGARLRRVMARTERLSVTDDRDGMLKEDQRTVDVPSAVALKQYVSAAEIAAEYAKLALRHGKSRPGDIVNYWKAAPYTLSYLDSYKALANLADVTSGTTPAGRALLKKLTKSPAALPWEKIRDYQQIPAAHAGLEQLWKDFFDEAHAERLLWMPASLPYYRAGGDFETPAARTLTKRLIFSAWNLAPTAIATLTSYECERRLVRAARSRGRTAHPYDAKRPMGLLRFAQRTASFPHLLFELVFPALAELTDPLQISAELQREGVGNPTLDQVLDHATERVRRSLAPRIGQHQTVSAGQGSTAWYALAPLLMEDDHAGDVWASLGDAPILESDDGEDEETEKPTHVSEHVRALQELHTGAEPRPPIPADLARVVALAGVAAPPSVVYRALKRSFPTAQRHILTASARHTAQAFRNLLNQPHSYNVITDFSGSDEIPVDADYWRKSLLYCATGNLQAVMDEYTAIAVENLGLNRGAPDDDVKAAASATRDVLQFRTTTYRPSAVVTDSDGPRWDKVGMRGDFALRLAADGQREAEGKRGSGEVSAAFNSPFWPFVLASTSVGQEGLDFHLYSHAITHWNLPTNPVDFEQREGRVHRYKCHAVRKNVAKSVPFPDCAGEPWQTMFAAAMDSRPPDTSDIVPYWVYAPADLGDTAAQIERHLPIAPYTRERSIKDPLLASVSVYRMAFGQPRQDELVKYVLNKVDDDLRKDLASIRIDLSPGPRQRSLD